MGELRKKVLAVFDKWKLEAEGARQRNEAFNDNLIGAIRADVKKVFKTMKAVLKESRRF